MLGKLVVGEIAVGEIVTGEIVLGKLRWGNDLTPFLVVINVSSVVSNLIYKTDQKFVLGKFDIAYFLVKSAFFCFKLNLLLIDGKNVKTIQIIFFRNS